LLFEVEDTGSGIAPEQLEEIFLPFQQVGKQYNSVEGTGLGLTISRRLVAMMGGKLCVKSTVDKGSIFWFELNVPEIPGDAPQEILYERKISGYKGERHTVLVVDDKQTNRAMLVGMLQPLGFHILEAENGQECVESASNHHPDLILLDLRMPVLNGFEATRRIRKLETGKSKVESRKSNGSTPLTMTVTLSEVEGPASSNQHPVIIGVSASVSEQIRQESLAAGCDDFLAKPVHLKKLLDRLQVHLDLEWIYEEIVKSEPGQQYPAELVIPSQDVLMNLLELAKGGYINDIQECIAQIKAADPRFTPFAARIEQLTDTFQYKQIIKYIRTYLQT
jgi:CheY-like chemotaxis protein